MIPYPVAILAGGLGTRLGGLTRNLPKAMVEIHGEPFIGHVLRLLAEQDYRQVVICTGHLSDILSIYVGSGIRFGVKVEYSDDGPTPLGTAGALCKAAPLLGPDFMVLYGDSYLDCDYRAVQATYERADCLGLMAICTPPEGYSPNVHYDNWLRGIKRYDKHFRHPAMRHIDYGLGVLDRGALSFVPDGFWDLADVYKGLAEGGELAGHVVGDRFHTVGTPTSLAETRVFLSERAVRV